MVDKGRVMNDGCWGLRKSQGPPDCGADRFRLQVDDAASADRDKLSTLSFIGHISHVCFFRTVFLAIIWRNPVKNITVTYNQQGQICF